MKISFPNYWVYLYKESYKKWHLFKFLLCFMEENVALPFIISLFVFLLPNEL